MTDLVIFDCDGVLVDSELLSARVLIDTLAETGIAIDRTHFERHFLGRSFPTVAASIRRDFQSLPADFEETYRARLAQVFEAELRPTAGLMEMLGRLDVPACVATSSSPPRVARSLRVTGLARFFEGRVFTASEVARGKPAPDLFLHAARRCGVPPGDCLVVEDSAPGLEAAEAAGMASLHFSGGAHLAGRDVGRAASRGRIAAWSELPRVCPELFVPEDAG